MIIIVGPPDVFALARFHHEVVFPKVSCFPRDLMSESRWLARKLQRFLVDISIL